MASALLNVSIYSLAGTESASTHQRTDDDVRVHVAVVSEEAEGTRVRAAPHRFQLVDDLHAPHLGATGDGAPGEHGPQQVDCVSRVGPHARDVAHDVDHVAIALVDHQLVHVHRAILAHTPEVVALQVD